MRRGLAPPPGTVVDPAGLARRPVGPADNALPVNRRPIRRQRLDTPRSLDTPKRLSSTPVRSTRVRSTRVRSTRVGSTRVGSTRVGIALVGSTLVATALVGSTRVATALVGSTRVGSTPIGSTLVGTAQVGSTRVAAARVGTTPRWLDGVEVAGQRGISAVNRLGAARRGGRPRAIAIGQRVPTASGFAALRRRGTLRRSSLRRRGTTEEVEER
ncbi:hypothetical protein Ais01nite_31620 [Asanoa ishikariensis]|uniref:Uncharacterized protein n=1 Tax=Asanoa ishikariensis TaxID=137265 RepID=A0A1H3UVF1_9ACTN|nr:hypothetical protein Ais01nite_31620 [Asanoa ishikariensis]SDZ66347.1 hypothetical protein SAMN05421684_8161 [Asanoa ishikariensis]